MEQQQVARLFRVLAALQIGANGSLNEGSASAWARKQLGFVSSMEENDLLADLSYF